MGNANCSCKYSTNIARDKRSKRTSKDTSHTKSLENLQVQVEHPFILSNDDMKPTSLAIPFDAIQRSKVKVMNLERPVGGEQAYEGEDEYDNKSMSMKRENSDFDNQAHSDNSIEIKENVFDSFHFDVNNKYEERTDKDAATEDEVINETERGHLSDPGLNKADRFPAVPQLKRSCSDPLSLMTHFSADKVMLKKPTSSQILPSRNQRLRWKLFLWSDRNINGAGAMQPKLMSNQQGGYASDTLEAKRSEISRKSPGSFTGKSTRASDNSNADNHSWGGLQANTGFLPQNQWVAFPAGASTTSRVDQWVRELELSQLNDDSNYYNEDGTAIPSPDVAHPKINTPEELVHANSVIQSLHSSTSVAHMARIGLKVIPSISCYSSLRSVNLSGNCIAHVTPGSLPKGLHVLDLSRNKINTIEGLREFTHLRVLNLSHNRISRIGQGLSNCILIKELYLAGNKISEVEGLHRLLKMTILDLSFNKIITTKSLGQLIANYYSLLALNLLGNPIQSNISDDQLRKTICSLLPKLAYLNRQPISPQKAREVHIEAILKAVMGDGTSSKRKTLVKRVKHVNSSSSIANSSKIRSAHKSRHSSKRQRAHESTLKKTVQSSTSS